MTTIAEVEDQSVLILVNACDSRKSVKAAAKERGVFLEDEAAKAVQEAPEGGSEGEADWHSSHTPTTRAKSPNTALTRCVSSWGHDGGWRRGNLCAERPGIQSRY